MTDDPFELDRIEAIAAALDLRSPNQEALESIAYETVQHFELDDKEAPYEAVVDAATGVGKTYIIAATIEYFAGRGTRNFAVITPNRTILSKTVANFTPGDPKSLLGGMTVEPVVVTSENFATPAMRAAMEDDAEAKLFVFTVQALTDPRTNVSRRTHKFQEGLGQAFYERLQEADDLLVLADEHHAYFSPAFSRAVRELHPRTLIGLTATPHRSTPEEQIIYRYPLAAAIADQLVKTPVLVGRKDDLSDPATKLADGVALLELKEQVIERYCAETGAEPVNPLMMVVAPSIDEANEIESVVSDQSFAGGRYADKVLTVHSDAPDEALQALDGLEEPDSPYRIVISVGMLNVGWDVKNVYVMCSLRASVSDLLTEQTLGRGLRLPFGRYTDIEILDTLEVLGHERYEDLLRKAGVLNEKFVDRRTRAVLRQNAAGQMVPQLTTTTVSAEVMPAPEAPTNGNGEVPKGEVGVSGAPLLSTVEDHTAKAQQSLAALQTELMPNPELPVLLVPRLRMTTVQSEFSLADITDTDPFRKLGERIAADPDEELRRTTLSARIVTGPDGMRRTELVTAPAVDKVASPAAPLPLGDAQQQLTAAVLSAPVVPGRAAERAAVKPIIEAFLQGLGDKAETVLAGYMDRACAGLIALVGAQQRRFARAPSYQDVVETVEFRKTRQGKAVTSRDRSSTFKRGVGYEGYTKSLYAQDWFDSSTERSVASIVDEADEVSFWVRLQRGDLPILWSEGGAEYNPDFIVVENDGTHWVVEAKADRDLPTETVQAKRQAAQRWANHVTADASVPATWRYLLVSESDVRTARGSWPALRQLGS